LLVFKLFPIGYGPTPNKRKDIVLKQEVVKGFELVLHKKKKKILFERRSFSLQSEWEFISKWWHTRSLQLFQVSGRCGRDFFKMF
jgi:hypothetical protein